MSNPSPAKKATAKEVTEQAVIGKEIERHSALEDIVPDIIGQGSAFEEESLRNVSSFEDALRLATQAHGEMIDATQELGDGFSLVAKEQIANLPLIVMEWTFRDGDFDKPYVSVRAVAKLANGQAYKVIFNDGGTGIAEQLAALSKRKNQYGNLMVPKGIYPSEYEGPNGPATTWYLNTSR